ncbi:sensor domain-containing diguanylate cyclase [Shewanella sp. Scap07]|uniref:sensor domain-containing diguanylate cyclase n=1 Tax=Shewanella sp. Scap07 TaxID=2589987 RepID=UPI0015C14214|nr:sensor domain-containing diguanylate cyclase [Shewanella sp. Scap07]QLE86586.1 sensor domain-containing diguanylate cyclase [Shewanella sp. Scap07]
MSMLFDKKWQYLPLVMLLISILGGLFFLNSSLDKWVTKTIKSHLSGLTKDVVVHITNDQQYLATLSSAARHNYFSNLSQATKDKRITLIDAEGVVLADTSLSYLEVIAMDNHLLREEIASAFKVGVGENIHFSSALKVDMLYVAQRVMLDNEPYVVRMAMPMDELKTMSDELMWIFIVLLSISAAAMAGSSMLSAYQVNHRVAKEREQQEERIMHRTKEIELLHRLANMLAACTSIAETQKVVEDIVPRILGEINGSVAMMRASRNQLEVKLDWGKPWPATQVYSPNDCWALRKGKYHLSNDDYHCLPCSHMAELGSDQTLCIPLTAHGNTIGMLHLYFGASSVAVDPATLRLAFTVAEHLGLALANLSLQDKLRSQALSDPLTGLYNRRHFEQSFDTLLLEAKNSQQSMTLMMLDLDHFKRFNDNFGHDAGDYVLKEVSTLIVQMISADDVACRLGGEELAVIVPNRSVESAFELANRIRKQIAELHLELKGLSLGKVTVSIGVVNYPKVQGDRDQLVKFADMALYRAKEQGRDQVLAYQASTAEYSCEEAKDKKGLENKVVTPLLK